MRTRTFATDADKALTVHMLYSFSSEWTQTAFCASLVRCFTCSSLCEWHSPTTLRTISANVLHDKLPLHCLLRYTTSFAFSLSYLFYAAACNLSKTCSHTFWWWLYLTDFVHFCPDRSQARRGPKTKMHRQLQMLSLHIQLIHTLNVFRAWVRLTALSRTPLRSEALAWLSCLDSMLSI